MKPIDVKKIRKSLGLSREEFAAKIPVNPATVWRWEQNTPKKKRGPQRLIRDRLEELAREAEK